MEIKLQKSGIKRRRMLFPHVSKVGSEDRISSLPDDICSHIISFLPLKDAVATSILSKRWRHIWVFSKNLDLDFAHFPVGMVQRKEKFIYFVDHLLVHRHGSQIQKLRLSFGFSRNNVSPIISTWICSALRCKVNEMDLDIAHGVIHLPSTLFTSESLKVLKLKSDYSLPNFPSIMNFSRLTTLRLKKVRFSKKVEVTPEIFCLCPYLEDLTMQRCLLVDFEVLSISSKTLKSLTIDSCVGLGQCKLKISSPSLTRFKYVGPPVKDYSLQNLSCLVEADINLKEIYHYDFDHEDFYFNISNSSETDKSSRCCVGKILKGISHAKVMKFSVTCIEHLLLWADSVTWLPTFFNLRHLKLVTGFNKEYTELIYCFLQKSPNLESLVIEAIEIPSPGGDYFEYLPKFYDLSYLKMNIGLSKDHIQLLTCLLENSPNLETLIVDILEPYDITGEDLGSNKLILEFPISHVKKVEFQHFGVLPKNIEIRDRVYEDILQQEI